MVFLLTCLVFAKDSIPPQLAQITDVRIAYQETSDVEGNVIFVIKSEDCFLAEDYQPRIYEQTLVFTIAFSI